MIFDAELTDEMLLSFANFSENITHGRSSGIDVATVNSELPLWFIKGQTAESFDLNLSGYLVVEIQVYMALLVKRLA